MMRLFKRRWFRRSVIALTTAMVVLCVGAWLWLTSDLPSIDAVGAGMAAPSARIFDRYGTLLYEILPPQQGRNTPVALDAIPLNCQRAVIATEDENFYGHPGVDPVGIARALWINLRGGDVIAGGSTITQQVARILLLNPRGTAERTLKRKLQEAILAVRLESAYSKDEILALYLNQAYFGSLAYGIEAAARAYFAKPASDLSLSECALLAGLLQAPAAYDPRVNRDAALERQAVAIRLLTEQGIVTAEQAQVALDDPLEIAASPFPILAPHFVVAVWTQLEAQFPDALFRDGLDVYTTLDLGWQQTAETVMRQQLALLNAPDRAGRQPAGAENAAMVALDPRTGEVRAMVGSPDYFNPDISGAVNGALALRQPGSTLKPFTYAAAMNPERADPWTASTVVLDVSTAFLTRKNELYTPANYGFVEHGPVSVREALASSLNIPAVKALEAVSVPALIRLAAAAGMTSLADNQALDLAVTLGGGEVRLLDLVAAYSIFPNGGSAVTPVMISRIEVRGGEVLFEGKPVPGDALIDPRVAWLVTDMLSDDEARTAGFGRNSLLNVGFPAAAKTGTTTDVRDNWVVGYTPSLVVGVWVGNADNRPLIDSSGLTGAAPIWHHFMRAVFAGQPQEGFPRPEDLIQREVCIVSGLLPTDECGQRRQEWFISGTEPTEFDQTSRVFYRDSRTGDWATPNTPDEFRLAQNVLILPPEAQNWATTAGVTMLTPEQVARLESARPTESVSGAMTRIVTPFPNVVYQISPALPRSAQRLMLEASAPPDAISVTLLLNGEVLNVLNAPPWRQSWIIEPGNYVLEALSEREDGTLERSDPVSFSVLDIGQR
jgi:penicillin-binding protein 1C